MPGSAQCHHHDRGPGEQQDERPALILDGGRCPVDMKPPSRSGFEGEAQSTPFPQEIQASPATPGVRDGAPARVTASWWRLAVTKRTAGRA